MPLVMPAATMRHSYAVRKVVGTVDASTALMLVGWLTRVRASATTWEAMPPITCPNTASPTLQFEHPLSGAMQ